VTSTNGFHPLPPPPPHSTSCLKLVCNVNIVYENLKSENSQDYVQKTHSTKLNVHEFGSATIKITSKKGLLSIDQSRKNRNTIRKPERLKKNSLRKTLQKVVIHHVAIKVYTQKHCCGSGMFIPDPGSRVDKVPDPVSGSASKNYF
jgi:hypothetical protein